MALTSGCARYVVKSAWKRGSIWISIRFKGKLEQAVGHVKQGVGEAFGDNKTGQRGSRRPGKRFAARETCRQREGCGTQTSAHEPRKWHATDRSASVRQNISDKVADAKNAVNERIDEYKSTHNR